MHRGLVGCETDQMVENYAPYFLSLFSHRFTVVYYLPLFLDFQVHTHRLVLNLKKKKSIE